MEEPATQENQILSDIRAGKYRNHFLVYARKSTDEPDNQKNSIKYQRAENTRFAEREKLPLAPITLNGFCLDGVISEKHSGFKESDGVTITGSGMVQYRIERPKFQRLIQFLSKGSFKGVIVLCWDRLSRNRGDDTIIRKLMKTGVEVRFVYANYDKTSAGALHMDIDGMFSEHYSRVIAEKVRLTTRNLRDQGICTYKAPLGYLNEGKMEHKPFDPVRAPIIKCMFELLATEEWSLSDLTKWANAQGLTNRPAKRRRTPEEMLAEEDEAEELKLVAVERPMTLTRIHEIVTDPFYTGKILGNDGKYVPSRSHEALVSDELFAKAQQSLSRKRISCRYAQKLDLPGRGLIRCTHCRRAYTPYLKKGIQYFNARCPDKCPNLRKNFSAKFFAELVGKNLERLSFSDAELTEIEARATSDKAILEQKRRRKVDQQVRRMKKVREDLTYLRETKLSLLKTGVYSPEGLRDEEAKLAAELTGLESAEHQTDVPLQEILEQTMKLSELLKNGSVYYHFADFRKKTEIMGIIFSELFFSENTLVYQCKNGFQALESRFRFVCAQTKWLSELIRIEPSIKSSIVDLERLLSHDLKIDALIGKVSKN